MLNPALARFAAASLLAATASIAQAEVRGPLQAASVSTKQVAPGAVAVYMTLTNTANDGALIVGASSPEFADARLVSRQRDRFSAQHAVFFAAGETGDFRASATHVLLTKPVKNGAVLSQLTLHLADGSRNTLIITDAPATAARAATPAAKPAATAKASAQASAQAEQAEQAQQVAPKKKDEPRRSRVVNHNPIRR